VDRTQGVTATVRYELTPDLELRSISGWREVETQQFDNAGGAHRSTFVPNANFSRYSLSELFQHQWSQEFQAVGTVGSIDYVAGLYYFTEKVRETAATPSTNRWNATGTGFTINSPDVLPPITSSNQGWQREDWFVARDSNATAKSYAIFGQATWTPEALQALHITAGARYTYDKRDGALTRFNNNPVNFPFRYREGRIDPMVTVAYDLSRDLHVYAKYATGFRAGGANSRSQTFSAFGPESVNSYEVGAKSEFLDRRVRLNLAAYLMHRKGTQTDFDFVDVRRTLADGSPNPSYNRHFEETANAPGTSKIKGFEADLTVQPIERLQLSASYAYTDIDVPPTMNPFLPGNPLFQVYTVFTPKHAASGAVNYEVPAGFADAKLRFHLDANYAGRQYSFQAEPVKTDASFIMNGRLALTDIAVNDQGTKLQVAVWARNLLNEAHIYRRSAANSEPVIDSLTGIPSYNGVLGDYGNFNAPRTFGVEARVSF
jgi:iron complex outermembrane receptor protein